MEQARAESNEFDDGVSVRKMAYAIDRHPTNRSRSVV